MSTIFPLLIFSLATCDAVRPQNPALPPPPFPGKPVETATADPSLPKPGELPDSASPEARSAWDRVCQASLVPDADHAQVRAFDLSLDVRYYKPGSRGSNDLSAQYRFLAPGFVRVKTLEGKREVGRGPKGDWLHDESRNQRVPLSVGREYAEDRRQLDEWSGVGRNFVSLTDPRSLRIADLAILPGPPASIPATLAARARELSWLSVRSPDFRLVGASPGSKLFRASLGADAKTGWVELALVEEDLPQAALRPTARLIEMKEPTPSQGFFVPRKIQVYSIEEVKTPPAFAVPAGMDLVVKSSNLRATFQPGDFELR